MDTLGRHLIAELYDCDRQLLDDRAFVEAAITAAAEAVGATVLHVSAHHYAPQGVTATVIIAESHLSIHTWPEHGYAAADIFTCGGLDPRPGFELLRERFRAADARLQVIVRGLEQHVAAGETVAPEDVVLRSARGPLSATGSLPEG